jgi:hypothetical protein
MKTCKLFFKKEDPDMKCKDPWHDMKRPLQQGPKGALPLWRWACRWVWPETGQRASGWRGKNWLTTRSQCPPLCLPALPSGEIHNYFLPDNWTKKGERTRARRKQMDCRYSASAIWHWACYLTLADNKPQIQSASVQIQIRPDFMIFMRFRWTRILLRHEAVQSHWTKNSLMKKKTQLKKRHSSILFNKK